MKTKISHIIEGMIEWLPQEGSREAAETQEWLKSGARDPLFRELEISHFCFSLCLGLTFSGPIVDYGTTDSLRELLKVGSLKNH